MNSRFQYRFSKKAEADMDEILSYNSIELSNPDSICAIPKIGRLVENEFLPDREVRKSLVGNYILYYLPDTREKIIYILRILYGRRSLDELVREINNY